MFRRVKEHLKISFKLKDQDKLNVSLNDYLCPICLEILIEPVDMPCKHEICLKCFDTMLDQSNLCCPMCRQRVSTWARTARINNSVVNLKKWKQIQELFPKEVKNRLDGKPTEPIEDMMKTVKKQKCVDQGEIRKEYLDLLKREEERLRQEKEKEEKLTREFIEREIQQENVPNVNDFVERQRLLISRLTTPTLQTPSQRLVLNENQNIENRATPIDTVDFATPTPVVVKSERPRRSNVQNERDEEFTRITRSRSIRLGGGGVATSSRQDILLNSTKITPIESTKRPVKRVMTLRR